MGIHELDTGREDALLRLFALGLRLRALGSGLRVPASGRFSGVCGKTYAYGVLPKLGNESKAWNFDVGSKLLKLMLNQV